MEILAAIAGKLAEFTVEPIGRQVGYLAHYKSNHQKLQTKLKELIAVRDGVQHKVDHIKREGKRIEATVLNWKTDVDAIITEAEEFLQDGRHAQTECLHGFCPHLVLRYRLSRKSTKLAEEIDELDRKKEFFNFAYDVLPQDLCLLSTGHYSTFDSRNSVVLRVMDELRNRDTEMILVWGIGGVGKTTLVEEVLRQAKDVNLFDDLVMVRDVKENPNLEKIQKEIAMKLGMSINEKHTLADREPLLGDRIKQKRTLVVLDDVWEKIDLRAIGLPRLVNLKVLLTCRGRKELSLDMRTQKDISVDVLNEEEAWSLFEKMAAGDVVKDSRIQSIAIEVAKNCGGLPVLIVTVARALKDRNKLHHWNDTLRRLRGFDNKELTEKAYLALEWSYDQLEDKELKPLFLLCGIIVVKNHIYLADLLKYGFCLDLIKNVNKIEDAREALYTLVDKLKDSCLLLDSDINMHVRMHDLVCEVATRIASREHHVLSVGYGGELKEWPEKDFFKRCSTMSLKSSNIPMLSQLSGECQKLELFYLYNKDVASVEIPANFFSEMEKLKVLGLIEVDMVSLPSSLQFLKNVQTLCLEDCELEDVALVGYLSNLEILSFARSNIEQLTEEIGQLIRLRWLDLSDCVRLRVISPGVISRLERLEDLSLRNVFLKWEAERGGSNASLLELKDLSQLTALEIYIEDANILPSNLFSSKLVRYQIYIGDVWKNRYSWEKTMIETALNTLKLKLAPSDELDHVIKTLLKRSEYLSFDGTESVKNIARQLHAEDFQQLIHLRLQNNVDFTYIINRKVVFPNLTTLSICSCDHLSFLFSFSMAKSLVELKHLEVSTCAKMEEIVSARDQSNGENINIMFCKLESLILDELPNLARFCTESCTKFSPVTKFDPELGASIFDPTSSKKLDVENGTAVQACLFDAQVKFPSLERLEIDGLGKLHTLWNNKFADQDSFCQLKKVEVSYCNSLKRIFPASVARRLQKLHSLDVENCDEVEEIIAGEQGLETEPPHFVFPKVTHVGFFNLPKLSRFYPGIIASKWPLLKQLTIRGCGKVKMFAAELPISSERHEPNPLIEQSLFLIDKVVFPNLTTLSIWNCDHLSFLFSFSMAQSLVELKHLEVSRCAIMEAIISTRDQPNGENIDIVFRKLESLTLKQLPNLDRFCIESCTEFSSVMKFDAELGASISDPTSSKKLNVENGTAIRACLFDPQVKFPSLERLEIDGLGKLHTLWNNKFADQDSFCQLKEVKVSNCNRLKKIFPVSVARRLQELHSLDVKKCDEVEEIIIGEQGLETKSPHLVFPKVTRVTFSGLPKLSRFSLGIIAYKWPLLKQLIIYGCGKVKMFAAELPISSERHEPNPLIEQSLFLIDKDSFPNLEHLTLQVAGEIWYGPSSSPAAQFFPKLKTICFYEWARLSKQAAIHFLEKLPNLEEIEVGWDGVSTEIFVNEEINGGEEIHAVKTLRVTDMRKLLQLGNGNSQTAGPLFPNLVTLQVFGCHVLKSVESSAAISFRNLTTLRVEWCDGLEYLTSYSVAKTLMQLTTLDVYYCKSLRAIIGASNEDDHDTGATCEIAFTRLQHLTLYHLPRLQGFCSGNCIVRLPSSTVLDVRYCEIELEISSEGVLLSNPKPERVEIAKPEIAEEVDDNGDGEKEKDEDVGTSRQDIEDRQE